MRIKKIRLRGFRGFNREQTIDLDHDVVLVYGLNGSGKSSVVQALEWLFFGDISRRERSSCRSEYMTNYLRNVHYSDSDENPFVEATILLNGDERVVKKELIGVKGDKCYVDGREMDDYSCLGVSLEEHSKPILSQGEIRSFVDTEQKARWEEVSSILGLKIFGNLREAVQKIWRTLQNRTEYDDARKQRNAALVRLGNKGWLPETIRAAEQKPYCHSRVVKAFKKTLSSVLNKEVDLESAKPMIDELEKSILKRIKSPEGLELLQLMSRELPNSKAEDLLNNLRRIIERLESLDRQSIDRDYARFLALGLEMATGTVCPFCEEETLSSSKKHELHKRFENNQDSLKTIEALEKQIRTFNTQSKEICDALTKQIPEAKRLRKAATQLQQEPLWDADGAAVAEVVASDILCAQEGVQEVRLLLDGLKQNLAKSLHDPAEFDRSWLAQNVDILKEKLYDVMAGIREARRKVDEIRSSVVNKAKDISEEEKSQLDFLAYLADLIDILRFFKIAGIYENKIRMLEALLDSADRFEKRKARELLRTLSEDVRQYYEKLNPQEAVQFRELVPSLGSSRQVRLKGESYGEELNPVTCFSEAHMNSLGISLYFPQRVDYNRDWGFMVLDDPIQSMDGDHSNFLIDILREHLDTKQIIIFSHSKPFCNKIKTRIGKYELLSYEFVHGNREGPEIKLIVGPIEVLLRRAKLLARGGFEDRRTAANHLRQAVERFLVEYLVTKGQNREELYGLETRQLMKRARNNAGLPDKEYRDIRGILDFGNPGSHGQDPTDIKPGNISWGMKTITDIVSKYDIEA